MSSSKRRARCVLTALDWETICTWREENRHVPNQGVIDHFSKEENGALRFKIRTLQEHMVMWRKLHGKAEERVREDAPASEKLEFGTGIDFIECRSVQICPLLSVSINLIVVPVSLLL